MCCDVPRGALGEVVKVNAGIHAFLCTQHAQDVAAPLEVWHGEGDLCIKAARAADGRVQCIWCGGTMQVEKTE